MQGNVPEVCLPSWFVGTLSRTSTYNYQREVSAPGLATEQFREM